MKTYVFEHSVFDATFDSSDAQDVDEILGLAENKQISVRERTQARERLLFDEKVIEPNV